MEGNMKKLILISGPSCVGKGPLMAAMKKFHPEIAFGDIPVIRSWGSRNNKPRSDEEDRWGNRDYFMPDADFADLDRDRYVVGMCRNFPQAIDLHKFADSDNDLLIMEVYHTIGAQFGSHIFKMLNHVQIQSVFISPVSQSELEKLTACGVDTDAYIVHLMLNKQIRRNEFMHKDATTEDIESFVVRAQDAPNEMRNMKNYTSVIVCREGEGSPLWHRDRKGDFVGEPEGDAARALEALVRLAAH
jgi:guanylate kinase